jgi:hypothetical protein
MLELMLVRKPLAFIYQSECQQRANKAILVTCLRLTLFWLAMAKKLLRLKYR